MKTVLSLKVSSVTVHTNHQQQEAVSFVLQNAMQWPRDGYIMASNLFVKIELSK